MKVQGVILAAGKGSRIFPLSRSTPKPLLPIVDEPLIGYQLRAMAALGIEDVIVVIGAFGYRLVEALGDGSRYGLRVRYFEQEKILGSAQAVGLLEGWIEGPFLVFLGDIYFRTDALAEMISMMGEEDLQAVLATRFESDPEMMRRNFAVFLDEEGRVRRVVEKPRHSRSQQKGCGIYLFTPEIFDAIRRTPRTALRDEYEITESIQILVDDGARVRALECVREDMNLTVPRDLLEVNLQELRRRGESRWVDPSAEVHPGARIGRSVVGRGARILHPIALSRCVVFEGTVVDGQEDVAEALLTPEGCVHLLQESSDPAGDG